MEIHKGISKRKRSSDHTVSQLSLVHFGVGWLREFPNILGSGFETNVDDRRTGLSFKVEAMLSWWQSAAGCPKKKKKKKTKKAKSEYDEEGAARMRSHARWRGVWDVRRTSIDSRHKAWQHGWKWTSTLGNSGEKTILKNITSEKSALLYFPYSYSRIKSIF